MSDNKLTPEDEEAALFDLYRRAKAGDGEALELLLVEAIENLHARIVFQKKSHRLRKQVHRLQQPIKRKQAKKNRAIGLAVDDVTRQLDKTGRVDWCHVSAAVERAAELEGTPLDKKNAKRALTPGWRNFIEQIARERHSKRKK